MPPPDAHVARTMRFAKINLKELKIFWKPFRKMDKNLSGTIDIAMFYKFLEEDRSIFGDAMFELNDCNNSGSLEFSEFFQTVVTYCLFEQEEILRYCFYILDKDKNGYIEKDELLMMINILYNIMSNVVDSVCVIVLSIVISTVIDVICHVSSHLSVYWCVH